MREPEKDPALCRQRRQTEVRINDEIKKAADAYNLAAQRFEQAKAESARTQNEVYKLQAAQAAATAAGQAPNPIVRGGAGIAGIGLEIALTRAEEKLRAIDGDSMKIKRDMEDAKEKQRFWNDKLAENAAIMRDLNCVFSY